MASDFLKKKAQERKEHIAKEYPTVTTNSRNSIASSFLQKKAAERRSIVSDPSLDEYKEATPQKAPPVAPAPAKKDNETWWDRVKDSDFVKAVFSGAKSYVASHASNMRTSYEAGQAGRTARDTEQREWYAHQLEQAEIALAQYEEDAAKNPSDYNNYLVSMQRAEVEQLRNKVGAFDTVIEGQVQQKATKATAELVGDIQRSAESDLEKAKEGRGFVGQAAMDLTAMGTQLVGDALVGKFLGNSKIDSAKRLLGKEAAEAIPGISRAAATRLAMGARVFGGSAHEAYEEGKNLNQQIAYGASSAALEVGTEMLFNGLAGLFGKGVADDVVTSVIAKMTSNPTGQKALRILASSGGEAVEEVIAGAVSPLLKDITYGEKLGSHYDENTVSDILYSALLGGIMGLAGGGVEVTANTISERSGWANEKYEESIKSMYSEEQDPTQYTKEMNTAYAAGMRGVPVDIVSATILTPEQVQAAYNEGVAFRATKAKATPAAETETKAAEGVEEYKALLKAAETPQETAEVEKVSEVAQAQKTAATVQEMPSIAQDATLEDVSKEYGKQANAMVSTYIEGQDVSSYAYAYRAAYNRGKSGVSLEATRGIEAVAYLSDQQIEAAYMAGRDAADIKAKTPRTTTAKKGGSLRAATQEDLARLNIDGEVVTLKDLEKTFKKSKNYVAGTAFRFLSAITQVTGMNVVVYQSRANAQGYFTSAQGAFNWADDMLYLDVNAGLEHMRDVDTFVKYTMQRTFGHEFTHFCEKWNPVAYNEFRRFVLDKMTESMADRGVTDEDGNIATADYLIRNKIAKSYNSIYNAAIQSGLDAEEAAAKAEKGKLSYDLASREVVAEGMTDIFRESKFAEELAEQHRTIFQKLVEQLKKFVAELRANFNKLVKNELREASYLQTTIDGEIRYLEGIVEKWDALARGAVENYQASVSKADAMSNEEAFRDSEVAVQNQIRPPYSDGSKAFNEFAVGLEPEARKTFDLFYGFYQKSRITNALGVNGKPVKKINISSVYLRVQEWNEMLAKDKKWAAAAKELAEFLPADVREQMWMNEDGTLREKPMEKEFKMPSSLAQRLVDALPFETVDSTYELEGKTITLPEGKSRQSVGGEAYRRAVLAETRKLFHEGKLRKVGIGTMSKDRWGSLGFLAANGKTGASGDFTTICPQMFFNRGCWYCYRRAAMASGVNNKLVAQSVWYTGEILRIRDSDIDALNKNGGLRIQSFGDWMPHFSSMLADVLYDAELRGLQVKIITKEPSMINYIAALREQGVGKNLYFNLSADYAIERAPAKSASSPDSLDAINPERPFMRNDSGDLWWKRAMTVEEAAKYREKYPWVNVRIVATDLNEFIRGLRDPRVDVVTGYHGNVREYERVDSTTGERKVEVEALGDAGMPRFSYNQNTNEWAVEYEGKTKTHKALANAIEENNLQWAYYTKTCCITGRCATCEGKCGKLARDFNVKNATNRDAESVAYWRKEMQYGIEPEFGDMTIQQQARETAAADFVAHMKGLVSNKGGWYAKDVFRYVEDHPSMNFVDRIYEKDKQVKKDLASFLDGVNDTSVLENLSWFMGEAYGDKGRTWTWESGASYPYRGAVRTFRNAIKKRINTIMAEKVGGTNLGIKNGEVDLAYVKELYGKLNTNDEMTDLAEKVFATSEKLGVNIRFVNQTLSKQQVAGDNLGDMVEYKTSYFNDAAVTDQKKANTILHELIHACTVYVLDANPHMGNVHWNKGAEYDKIANAATRLNRIYNEIRYDRDFANQYGIKNAKEMVAELANENFVGLLKKKNLWEQVVDFICELFGYSRGNKAYDNARLCVDYILDNPDVAEYKEHAKNVRGEARRAGYDVFGQTDIRYQAREVNNNAKKNIESLTEETVTELLSFANFGAFGDGTYIPVRKDTPSVLVESTRGRETGEIKNHPLLMQVKKARQSMTPEGETYHGAKGHGYDEYSIIEAIRNLDHPKHIVFEHESGRYAVVVGYRNKGGKHALIPIDLAQDKDATYLNGYSGGTYNIAVTVFNQEDLDAYLANEDHEAVEIKDAPQRSSSSSVPSLLNGASFDDNTLAQDDVAVKVENQERTTSMTDREILEAASNANEGVTEGEKDALKIFQKRLKKLNDLQAKRKELGAEWQKQQFGGERDEARMTRNRINLVEMQIENAEKDLIAAEQTGTLQGVIDRARKEGAKAQKKRDDAMLKQYRERRDTAASVKKYRDRIEKKAKKLTDMLLKNSDKQHIPEVLKVAVGEFLETLDFTSKRQLSGGEATKKDNRFVNTLDKIHTVLDKQAKFMQNPEEATSLDMYIDLPEGFTTELKGYIDRVRGAIEGKDIATTYINLMSAEELADLDFILGVIDSSIRKANELLANARYQSVSEASESTIAYLSTVSEYTGKNAKAKKFLNWDNTTPVYAFKRFGEAGKAIFEGLMNGWDKLAINAKAVIDFADKTYTAKEVKAWSEKLHTFELGGRTAQMSIAQIMSLYCLVKRKQAQGHLFGGGMRIGNITVKNKAGKESTIQQAESFHLTMEDVSRITSVLTDRQVAVAEALQQYMNTVGTKWGNEVSMARFGYNAFTEENYFPIESDSNNLPAIDPDARANDLFRLLNMCFTKSLTPKANNALVVSDIFDVFSNHMTDMAKYNALALPVLDTMKFYNYKNSSKSEEGQVTTATVQKAIERAYGAAAKSYVIQFMKDMNGVNDGGRSSAENFAMKMVGNYKVAAVGANLRVALLQPTSIVRAAAVIDPRYLAKALTMKPNAKEMLEHSGIAVWKSLGFYDTNIGRGVREQIKHEETFRDKVIEKSMIAAEMMDRMTWGAIWNACKLECIAKGETDLMAATEKRFREVIYASQVVDATITRSQTMRSTSSLTKMLTSFMSEPTLSFNMLMDSFAEYTMNKRKGIKNTWENSGKQITRGLLAYGASAAAAALAESIFDALRDDDDYETFLEKFWEAFWGDKYGYEGKYESGNLLADLNPINKLPIVKDIMNHFTGYENNRMDTQWLTSITDAVDAWKSESRPLYGKIYKTLQALSRVSGLPFSNLTREVVTIYNNTIGVLTGQKLKTWSPNDYTGIKEAFEAGHLTREEAAALLVEKVGYTQSKAKNKTGAWEFQNENPDIALSDSRQEDYINYAKPAGISVSVFQEFADRTKEAKGVDKNGDGRSDPGTKMAAVAAIIHSLPITKKQKDVLFLLDFAEKNLETTPWH